MRAVLDTNVLISSVIANGTPHDVVVKGFLGEYQIIVSTDTPAEFRKTLLKYPEKFHPISSNSTRLEILISSLPEPSRITSMLGD